MVTDDDIAAFERDGVVCIRGQFEGQWLDRLAAGIEAARRAPGPFAQDHSIPGESAKMYSDLSMARRIPAFEEFVWRSPAAEIAARLARSTQMTFFSDAMWVKESGASRKTPWHHDQPYYQVDGQQIVLVWLALDPVDRATCLEFLPGSHRWDKFVLPERVNGGSYEGYEAPPDDKWIKPPDIEALRADGRILGWDLEPGDAICFHGMTLHGAPGNASGNPRRAITTIWCGDDVRFVERPGEMQPRFEGHGLKPGDPLTCEMFPQVWPPREGARA